MIDSILLVCIQWVAAADSVRHGALAISHSESAIHMLHYFTGVWSTRRTVNSIRHTICCSLNLVWFDLFHVRIGTMTAISTAGHRFKSTPTNGPGSQRPVFLAVTHQSTDRDRCSSTSVNLPLSWQLFVKFSDTSTAQCKTTSTLQRLQLDSKECTGNVM